MLLSSSNWKYPPFPLLSYFSVVVCLRCLLHHILSLIAYTFQENREFVFIIIVQFMMSASFRIHFGLQIVLVCLYSTPSHYHHCLPISVVMIGRIYIICLFIIIKSEVWTITHCLGLGHETMVSAVCLSIFLWICDMAGLLCGTFVSFWYLPRIPPSVIYMQYYYHARWVTDDWRLAYMFSLVYFSIVACLEGTFPHSISTRRDSCIRVFAPLTLASPLTNKKSNRGDPALHLNQARGHLNWRMGLPALLGGNLGCRIV